MVYSKLYDDLVRAFDNALVQPLSDLLREQLACVKHSGFPMIDVDGALFNLYEAFKRPAWAPILVSAGVEITLESVPGDDDATGYQPADSEIDFALAYVHCGEQIGVLDRFEQIQNDARISVLAKYENRIIDLQGDVKIVQADVSQ